jgi:hypothetical protein
MRAVAILAMCGTLAACAGVTNEGGIANYDALRKATADCEAKGGELKLQNGGDPEVISDFSCKRK